MHMLLVPQVLGRQTVLTTPCCYVQDHTRTVLTNFHFSFHDSLSYAVHSAFSLGEKGEMDVIHCEKTWKLKRLTIWATPSKTKPKFCFLPCTPCPLDSCKLTFLHSWLHCCYENRLSTCSLIMCLRNGESRGQHSVNSLYPQLDVDRGKAFFVSF